MWLRLSLYSVCIESVLSLYCVCIESVLNLYCVCIESVLSLYWVICSVSALWRDGLPVEVMHDGVASLQLLWSTIQDVAGMLVAVMLVRVDYRMERTTPKSSEKYVLIWEEYQWHFPHIYRRVDKIRTSLRSRSKSPPNTILAGPDRESRELCDDGNSWLMVSHTTDICVPITLLPAVLYPCVWTHTNSLRLVTDTLRLLLCFSSVGGRWFSWNDASWHAWRRGR